MSKKTEQILAGLRRLNEQQLPGQCFSPAEIGRACSCHERSVVATERRAVYKLAKRLQEKFPGMLEEAHGAKSLKEIIAGLIADPWKTGRPSHVTLRKARREPVSERGDETFLIRMVSHANLPRRFSKQKRYGHRD
jgi:hypothetical protein